jgi:ArsR family transcriptional regulator
MSKQEFNAAEFFKALGHPVRLGIVEVLSRGEQSVTQIQTALKVGQVTASQHIATLRNAGIVDSRPAGATKFYSLKEPVRIKAALKIVSIKES